MIEARIKDIQIQPLKGGGPLKLTEARMTKAGLETPDGRVQDHFLIAVTAGTDELGYHNFLTQRVQVDRRKNLYAAGTPQLALVRPKMRGDSLIFQFNQEEVKAPQAEEDDPSRTIPVQVWEYRGNAVEVPIVSEWLSDQLKRSMIVARTSGPWDRMSRQNFEANHNPLRAQDGYPVHAVALADAKAVFGAIGAPVDSNRFRYQVLLDDVPFRQIHDYGGGIINGIEVHQPKPCSRCEVTGVDQETGEFSSVKPLAGLAKLGVGRWIRNDRQRDHVMGENWLPMDETIIKQGDIFQFTVLRGTPLQFEERKYQS